MGTIYRRFADKDELIGAAILDVVSMQDGEQVSDYQTVATDASDLRDFLRRYALAAIGVSRDETRFLEAMREYVRGVKDAGWLKIYRDNVGKARQSVAESALSQYPSLDGRDLDLSIALASIHGAIGACLVDPSSGFAIAPEQTDELVEKLTQMAGDFLERQRGDALNSGE